VPTVTEPPVVSPSSAATPEAALWAWFGSDAPLRVKAFKLVDRPVPDHVMYRVVVWAEPDSQLPYGWSPGDNVRWVTLRRVPSGWVIVDVASAPPP
jgi:hypothetical protein